MMSPCPWVMLPEIQDMWVSFWFSLLCQHSFWSKYWLMCQYPYLFYAHMIVVQLFSVLSCSDVGIINLLPLMANTSMIAVSSLNDQHGCSSLCSSVFVDGKLWNMSSANSLGCPSPRPVSLISSAVILACLCMTHIALIVMYMPGFSSSLSVLQLCVDSQSVTNSQGPGLYSILMLYLCICNSIL